MNEYRQFKGGFYRNMIEMNHGNRQIEEKSIQLKNKFHTV